MGITFKALQGAHSIADIDIAIQHNMEQLLQKLQVLEAEYGHAFVCTSGYRTPQDQKRIYDTINDKRKRDGLVPFRVPQASQHLVGCAADIFDPTGHLYTWLKEDKTGIATMGKLDLYGELGTRNWVHLQLHAPASKNRWFLP